MKLILRIIKTFILKRIVLDLYILSLRRNDYFKQKKRILDKKTKIRDKGNAQIVKLMIKYTDRQVISLNQFEKLLRIREKINNASYLLDIEHSKLVKQNIKEQQKMSKIVKLMRELITDKKDERIDLSRIFKEQSMPHRAIEVRIYDTLTMTLMKMFYERKNNETNTASTATSETQA